ncbi:MAG: ATP phosphoribosyltransferase [Candidatus Obscuribacterales bacterium]|nr:ATP phosphoribosyltransferase [Candidatus Obscuribacterales bacterium]
MKNTVDAPTKERTPATTPDTGAELEPGTLKMVLPSGRIQEKVVALLERVGLSFAKSGRSYRPRTSQTGVVAKFLKAQNIPDLVALGRHDCGFSGLDWIVERQADVVELLDLGFDPVSIVAAMPENLAKESIPQRQERRLVIASEYRNLSLEYIKSKNLNADYVQTFGATEALPPEDADMIIDNTATGETIRQNRLVIVDTLLKSSTRFLCNKKALEDDLKRQKLEELVMLMKSALRANEKVLLEMNVSTENFERLVAILPCMKAPTISELYKGSGYAIKVAVPSADCSQLIPKLVAFGATDILEYKLEKIVV